jgi:hypothetical protein
LKLSIEAVSIEDLCQAENRSARVARTILQNGPLRWQVALHPSAPFVPGLFDEEQTAVRQTKK